MLMTREHQSHELLRFHGQAQCGESKAQHNSTEKGKRQYSHSTMGRESSKFTSLSEGPRTLTTAPLFQSSPLMKEGALYLLTSMISILSRLACQCRPHIDLSLGEKVTSRVSSCASLTRLGRTVIIYIYSWSIARRAYTHIIRCTAVVFVYVYSIIMSIS